jgi:hypothetical protein
LPEGVIPRAKWKLNVRKYKTPQALEKDYFYQNELKQSIVEDVGIYPNIIHELRFLLFIDKTYVEIIVSRCSK